MGQPTPKLCCVCDTPFVDTTGNQRKLHCKRQCTVRSSERRSKGLPLRDADQPPRPMKPSPPAAPPPPAYADEALLRAAYVVDNRSIASISRQFRANPNAVRRMLLAFGIPLRSPSDVARLRAKVGPEHHAWSGKRICPACGGRKDAASRTCQKCCRKDGSHNPKWRGSRIGYAAAHDRVKARHGSATEHACLNCGGEAAHWSYNHDDPNQLHDFDNGPYSLNINSYSPRCRSCHKSFDHWHRQVDELSRLD